jgi:hypothetical protein
MIYRVRNHVCNRRPYHHCLTAAQSRFLRWATNLRPSPGIVWNLKNGSGVATPIGLRRWFPRYHFYPFLCLHVILCLTHGADGSRWNPCTYPCANRRGTSDTQDVVCERQRVKDRDAAGRNRISKPPCRIRFVTGLRSLICATAALGLRSTSIRFRQRLCSFA